MKKLCLLLGLLCVCSWGQTDAIQGHTFVGGTPAATSGMKSANYLHGIIPGASVTVYLTGTQIKATIYADGSNTPLSNPFFSNAAAATDPGGFLFYALDNQGYDIQAQGGQQNASCTTAPLCYTQATMLLVDVKVGTGGTGSGTVQASPQFLLPYFDQTGTQAHVKGDTGSTTDGSGGVSVARLVTKTSPSYNILAYGASTGSGDNGTAINQAIAAVNANNGGTVLIPDGAWNYSTQINLSNTVNVTLECASKSRSTSASACELICTRTDATTCINSTGATGLTISGINIQASSTAFTGYLLDISGSSLHDTSDFRLEDSRISGPGGTTATKGICDNCNNSGGAGDTSSEHIYLRQNFFDNLAFVIEGPQAGSVVDANDTHLEGNYFGGSFAQAPLQIGAGSWYVDQGNVFEPLNGAGGTAAVVKLSSVGPVLLYFTNNWVGDGSSSNTSSIVIDASSVGGTYQLQKLFAQGNYLSGFYSFLKNSANVLNSQITNNVMSGCTAIVDQNGASFLGSYGPNYVTCTYPMIDTTVASKNYPTFAQSGEYITRSVNIGIGQNFARNWEGLSPNTTAIANGFIGETFGGFNQNPSARQWFNGFILPSGSMSSVNDPDYSGNSGPLLLGSIAAGGKWCSPTGTANTAGFSCLYFDNIGNLHFRTAVATTSIQFTNGSTTATVVGPTTNLSNGAAYFVGDSSCSGASCVPAGTTGVYNSAGGTLTLSSAATASNTVGSSIALTSCTFNPGSGQASFANSGTNGLAANQVVYINFSAGNCSPFGGLLEQVAYEGLSSTAFNVFTQVTGSGTFTQSGTAQAVPNPATLWVDNTVWYPTSAAGTMQLGGNVSLQNAHPTSTAANVNAPYYQANGWYYDGSLWQFCGTQQPTMVLGSGATPTATVYMQYDGCPTVTWNGTRWQVPGPFYFMATDKTHQFGLDFGAITNNITATVPNFTPSGNTLLGLLTGSLAGGDLLQYDSPTGTIKDSGVAASGVSHTVASGTATMTTAAIASGACGTTVTVAAAAIATTDVIDWSYNLPPGANPGVLTVNKWPTAGNVNFAYCNPTAASVTPAAATLNWHVIR